MAITVFTDTTSKSELTSELSLHFQHISQRKMKKIVDTIFNTMHNTLVTGGSIEICDFGMFSTHTIAEHTVRNPRTGDLTVKEEHLKAHFRAGKRLKAALIQSGQSAH